MALGIGLTPPPRSVTLGQSNSMQSGNTSGSLSALNTAQRQPHHHSAVITHTTHTTTHSRPNNTNMPVRGYGYAGAVQPNAASSRARSISPSHSAAASPQRHPPSTSFSPNTRGHPSAAPSPIGRTPAHSPHSSPFTSSSTSQTRSTPASSHLAPAPSAALSTPGFDSSEGGMMVRRSSSSSRWKLVSRSPAGQTTGQRTYSHVHEPDGTEHEYDEKDGSRYYRRSDTAKSKSDIGAAEADDVGFEVAARLERLEVLERQQRSHPHPHSYPQQRVGALTTPAQRMPETVSGPHQSPNTTMVTPAHPYSSPAPNSTPPFQTHNE